MLKRIISVILSVACVLSLASCGANESGQSTAEESSAEIPETESVTRSINEETAESETETSKAEKIYLDASEEDFDDLFGFYGNLLVVHFLRKGFSDESASLSCIMPAVKEYIHTLYGDKEVNIEEYDYPAPRYHGLITRDIDYSYQDDETIKENRKVVDPLFRFKDWPENNDYSQGDKWYQAWFYSVDAETVEWMVTELFGGTPDREDLISDADTGISCYYCDGRYYFQDLGGYGGEGHAFKTVEKKQEPDGRYIVDFKVRWASETTWNRKAVRTVVGLVEKGGEKYWKIFSIDWDIMKLLFEEE